MAVPSDEAVRPPFADRIVAGLSLLIIVSYAPFSIAALLAPKISFPLGFLVAMVFLSMSIGTLLSAKLTRTGLVVAPAVGMASIVNNTRLETLNTTQFLLATVFAGWIAFALSRPRPGGAASWRQVFLNNLPRPVLVGVRGGVGALLAAVAIRGVQDSKMLQGGRHYLIVVIMFVISIIVLLISEIAQRMLERRASDTTAIGPRLALIAIRASYVIMPLLILVVLYLRDAFPLPTLVWPITFPNSLPLFGWPISDADLTSQLLVFFSFMVLVLFIFLTDIPGSVFDFFQTAMTDSHEAQQRIDRSFVVTSIMTAANPVVGLFTSVYYAENYVLVRDAEASRTIGHPWTAWFCGLAFLACAAVFLCVEFRIEEMKIWFLVAVAPALFCVGIRMTAWAMRRDFLDELRKQGEFQEQEKLQDEREVKGEEMRGAETRVGLSFFIPVALTVLLTHFVGFELALPVGIIYYALSEAVATDDWQKEWNRGYGLLLGGSCLVALILAIARIQSLS